MMVHSGVDALNHGHHHGHSACSNECVSEVSSEFSSPVMSRQTGRRNSKSLWSSLFSSPKKSRCDKTNSPQSEDVAKFVHHLVAEGRSAENISVHLSHLRDVDMLEQQQQQQQQQQEEQQRKGFKKESSFVKLFKSLHNALKDEHEARQLYMYAPPLESHYLTVSISVAPFYAAPPPDRDISFDELATLEPIYNSNKSINLLPITKYDGTPLPGDQTSCAICLGDFVKEEELKSLHCVHFYHKECIDRWLMVGHNCPMCKALVL